MNALDLARWQFGITTVYHFFFVPLTLGLSIVVAIFQTNYVRTNKEIYKTMTKFWGKLFLINFAMGVVTGLVQEFQFGMNWSSYSRFMGDIFGAPLAIEALLAFYIESTFLGVWIFGWGKLPKKVHLATIWLVAIGSNISALWILIANSFMQEPVGYALKNGRAVMTDFWAVITNPNVLYEYPHVFFGALVTTAFFILGISGYHLMRNTTTQLEMFRTSFRFAAVLALAGGILVMLVGHAQMQHIVQTQPMKVAAAEALYTSEDPASLSLFTIGDLTGKKEVFSIRVPDLLSILSYNAFTGKVAGIDDLQAQAVQKYGPGDYTPPVPFIYWSFRTMVGFGLLMAAFALFAVFFVMRKNFEQKKWLLRVSVYAIALPYLANTAGWLLTEIGRQPWIVYGLLATSSAVSPSVNAGSVLFSLITFTLLYGVLMVADVYLLAKYANPDSPKPEDEDEAESAIGSNLVGTF